MSVEEREYAQATRDAQAVELRRAGMSYEAIAQRLGYADRSGPHHAVTRALARQGPADIAEARAQEVDRLDRLLVAVWPAALRNEPRAIDHALRIGERRARLLGLDAPAVSTQGPVPRPRLLIWEDDDVTDPLPTS